jgi:iron complex outermembrane recepter protein
MLDSRSTLRLLSALLLVGATAFPLPAASQPREGSAVAPLGALAGRVVEGGNGRPVEGALVLTTRPVRSAVTDRDGRFFLREPGDGPLRIRVEAPGYAALEAEVRGPVHAPPGGASAPLVLELLPDPLRLEGLAVTASPLRGTAVYQPSAALDGEELQRRMGISLAETLDGSPGVTLRSMGPAPSRPVIRGLDGDRVLILQNGERTGDLAETAPDHAVTLDPLAAERVEVVRGPASLLYGSSALGGVVNVLGREIPRDWAPGTSGRIGVHGATVNRLAAVAGELLHGGGGWAVGVRGSAREAGDLGTPAGPLPGTFSRSRSGGVGLGLRGGAGTGGVAASAMEHEYGLPEDGDGDVRIRLHRTQLQGRIAARREGWVEGVELRVQGGEYAHDEVERAGPGAGERVGLAFQQRSLSATGTLRHGAWGPVGQGALAVTLHHRVLRVGGEEALIPDGRRTALGLAAFQELPLGGSVRLQAGVRGELLRSRALPNRRFGPPAPGGAWLPGEPRVSGTLSGAVGVAFRPAEGWEAGAQVARAHRAPTPEELWSDAPHPGAGAYEVGEPSLGHEVGHGMDLFVRRRGGRVRAEVALFGNRIDGFIVQRPGEGVDPASGLPVVRYAAADALLLGGEARVEVIPAQGWSLRVTADHVRGSLRGPAPDPLPFMPPFRVQLEGLRDAGIGWAGVGLRAVARQGRTAPGELSTPGYALLGGEIGVRLGHRKEQALLLRVDNVLDREWRDHLSRLENRGAAMPGRNLALVFRAAF